MISDIIRKIEKNGEYIVLDVYDFDANNYLVTCEYEKTGSRDSDYFYLVRKVDGKISGYNPAVNPFEYAEKIEKAKIVYSK